MQFENLLLLSVVLLIKKTEGIYIYIIIGIIANYSLLNIDFYIIGPYRSIMDMQ